MGRRDENQLQIAWKPIRTALAAGELHAGCKDSLCHRVAWPCLATSRRATCWLQDSLCHSVARPCIARVFQMATSGQVMRPEKQTCLCKVPIGARPKRLGLLSGLPGTLERSGGLMITCHLSFLILNQNLSWI